jgi:dimethylglycine dehydrogenase
MKPSSESKRSADGELPGHVRVAVIGGGINGCSMLYHLGRLGWTDAILLEKNELTAGSTWHAAGMVPGFAESLLVTHILKTSLDFYAWLAQNAEDPVDVHRCGSIRLARSEEEIDENRRFLGIARELDMAAEIIGPARIRSLYPLLETDGITGGLWLPNDCYTDPSQTTHAIAKLARRNGARIFRHAEVQVIERLPNGSWRVQTSRGAVNAEYVVNCGGIWAREISALVGGVLPAISIEHEYLVTETMPAVEALDFELPMLWDMSVPMYTRADRKGLIVSCYEDRPKFFGLDGIPPEFGQQLLPPDLERTESRLEVIFGMIPALRTAGVRSVVNGPTPRSADMMPLVGPAHGYENFFVMCGVSGGFLFSGLTRYAAEWLIEGAPSINMAAFDVRRFGSYADARFAAARLASSHAFEQPVYHPYTEPEAARCAWTTPLYDRLKAKGAVFGVVNGWEVPNWFAANGMAAIDKPSHGRANWFEPVGVECRGVHEGAGLLDWSCVGKFEVAGPGAERHLDRLSANRLPQKTGSLRQAPVLSAKGSLASHLLIGRLGPDRFYVTGEPASAARDGDMLRHGAPADVAVTSLSNRFGALALAGPKAGEVLSGLGVSADAGFGFWELRIAGAPARLLRLNWGPIPVFEIHLPMECLLAVFEAAMATGARQGIVDFGLRARHALRIEAGIPAWGVDVGWNCDPWQAGLGRFVALDKAEFAGKQALAGRARGRRLARIELDVPAGARALDPWGDEIVLAGERLAGVVTSGGFGHGVGRSVALVMLDPELAPLGSRVEVEILGRRYEGVVAACA